ncbi:MAG TPA: SRPBCC family protein [Phycisphaerales bacterium]|nr:SRPBCC family protein [Phycisphaerales bacterium]
MARPENLEQTASEREIVLSRVYDAPPELVWRAWTDPEHIGRWWGPTGFTTTTHRIEVRPGGQWRFVMHGPDGTDYENLVTYVEVVEPERLVYRHGGAKDVEPVDFTVTATFEKLVTATFDSADGAGTRTRVTLRMVFPSPESRDFAVREYGAIEGGRQTLARLAEHLRRMSGAGGADGDAFIISRVLRAPRDLVWRAWTERDRLAAWFGPKGATIPRCTLDVRPGGVFHYCMRGPGEEESWGTWTFRGIAEAERLEFIVSFADEDGRAVRAPFDDTWPLGMLSTVTFEAHAGKGGGTVVTVRWSAHPATAAEQETFAAGHGLMRQGWAGTFDRLEEHLSRGG